MSGQKLIEQALLTFYHEGLELTLWLHLSTYDHILAYSQNLVKPHHLVLLDLEKMKEVQLYLPQGRKLYHPSDLDPGPGLLHQC